MNDPNETAPSTRIPHLSGELRRLPAPLGWRLLEAVSFVLLFRAGAALLGRHLPRYRHEAQLELHPEELRLLSTRRLLGVSLGQRTRTFALGRLSEITLEAQGEDLRFAGGLGALFLGTFFGVWLLTDAAVTASGSLFIVAILLLLFGVTADFLVGSGRTPRAPHGHAQLTVVSGRRGFVISAASLGKARSFLEAAQGALSGTSATEHAAPAPYPVQA